MSNSKMNVTTAFASKGKAVEVAPGMFRSPTPVSKEGQPQLLQTEPQVPESYVAERPTAPPEGAMVTDASPDEVAANPVAPEPSSQPPTPTTLSEMDGLIAHAKLVRKELLEKWAGKEGVNPFIYVKQNIDPLIERARNGDKSTSLKSAMLALNSNVKPVVNVPVVEK